MIAICPDGSRFEKRASRSIVFERYCLFLLRTVVFRDTDVSRFWFGFLSRGHNTFQCSIADAGGSLTGLCERIREGQAGRPRSVVLGVSLFALEDRSRNLSGGLR